jgi:hypothetical protein
MIPEARKRIIIEGLFRSAESLPELRWLNGILGVTLNNMTWKDQLRLSEVLEDRVEHFESQTVELLREKFPEAEGEFHDGPQAVGQGQPGSGCQVLPPDAARGARDGAPLPFGSRCPARTRNEGAG